LCGARHFPEERVVNNHESFRGLLKQKKKKKEEVTTYNKSGSGTQQQHFKKF
jgi:hypothetical protein